ncbi:general transcription factor IIF subunit 2 isoform X1 [Oryzias latipes]
MSNKVEVNLTGVRQSKGVWLVKVPKYLSQQWDKATEKGEVGKITIGKKQGKTEVCFSLSEELAALGSAEEKDASVQVPRDHPFTMQTVGGQTMAVFSQSDTDGISLEGTVVHRAECRPNVSEDYMKIKRLTSRCRQCHSCLELHLSPRRWSRPQGHKGNFLSLSLCCAIVRLCDRLQSESVKPQRLSQQLDRAITTVFKPVANHDFNVEFEKKKKSEGKMVRAERQVVMDMLFSAFEKHQYYSFKDLVDITKQPVTYLKEIVREIGVCNRKGAHKSSWELKPEYQHYRADDEEEEKQDS